MEGCQFDSYREASGSSSAPPLPVKQREQRGRAEEPPTPPTPSCGGKMSTLIDFLNDIHFTLLHWDQVESLNTRVAAEHMCIMKSDDTLLLHEECAAEKRVCL